jgi:GNAT superfamily N-acetyltransferase
MIDQGSAGAAPQHGAPVSPGIGKPTIDGELEIRRESFSSPVAQLMLAQASAYILELYGDEDQAGIVPEQFSPARSGMFLVAYFRGDPVGCGGLRQAEAPAPPDAAELKRLFVVETARRRGIARRILDRLEETAKRLGYAQVVLDTGSKQEAAVALYTATGYHQIPGYSVYCDSPCNRAYAKELV